MLCPLCYQQQTVSVLYVINTLTSAWAVRCDPVKVLGLQDTCKGRNQFKCSLLSSSVARNEMWMGHKVGAEGAGPASNSAICSLYQWQK